MAGGCAWSRRVAARTRTLRGLVRDTQRALHDVCDILHFDPEILTTVQEISNQSVRSTALVVLGTTPSAKVRLLHCLLGRRLLPDPPPRGCRWVRIQYGSITQVHMSLGNSEFELVEELECNKSPWDTLPVEDLIRRDNSDLSTILEVEINNQILKDGLCIVIPPDIPEPSTSDHQTLKKVHTELYMKRDSILKNFNPVYLYGIDRTGKNVFSDNLCLSKVISRSDEDFWSTFNLYYMTRVNGDKGGGEKCDERDGRASKGGSREAAVFDGENCLDLHQIKDINPHSQVLFVLFSDSVEIMSAEETTREASDRDAEATESTEGLLYNTEELPESDQGLVHDGILRHTLESPERLPKGDKRRLYEEQTAFLNELLDQWELMSSPTPKHYVKSQWIILNESDLLQTVDQKALAPYTSNAIQNSGETFSKGKREDGDRTIKTRIALLSAVVKFATDCLQTYLLAYCTRLSEVQVKLLQQFILASFDMARELQVVPKKIQYVATQEQQLYDTITEKFSEGDKKQELLSIMRNVLQEMEAEVNNMDWSVDDLPCHQDRRFTISNSIFYSSRSSPGVFSLPTRVHDGTPSDGEEAASYDKCTFEDYEIIVGKEDVGITESYGLKRPQEESMSSGFNNIRVENECESFSFSHSRSVSTFSNELTSTTCTNTVNISIKQASLDVQQTVLSQLSRMISLKLVKFVDCLKDTYFGTLQRCLESLESCCRQELGGRPASEAMRQVVSVARQVDLQPCASFSLLRSLLESLRRLLHKLRIVGGEAEEACCVLSPVWRRRVAQHTISSLSPHRLARVISAQILERLSVAHEKYQSALATLESALTGRLHHTEDIKLAIRKKYAPAFARLCLESTSMCDLLMYGTPELGREIGRGQYGVVYSVRGGWGGHSPAAVKSVLPADERHYHELAMEFFYTRSIPAHPRIVPLHGSIVQRHSGAGPSVLLVSQRKCRDLHAAVRTGLSFSARMRISCDIVEGIRYLHSLGLVHRDIKMKNVLLDSEDRASLSDLGFCAAEALMSGSVVGTPVHMAPELLAGEYDAAVDVYAFGILFWYVCAGNIKLPSAFETFQNKEQLWSKVKRGLRPERLPHFTDECWEVMKSCWASEPTQRALLGDVQPKLESILEQALLEDESRGNVGGNAEGESSDGDSLDMTGIDDCL
ncbi:hypothetical protein K1T71_013210 [Dendrolimus kikuchii]|uniref:Uncharacterized protein n=1 Tax=Dendrolimus kikuchii TaxID=765133 RepID=A0ACC1CHG5_9NEOP|nr:hypothetical protein K1T71_013210 [Dendrolimus kikuchii]